jgi:hypothetical protein
MKLEIFRAVCVIGLAKIASVVYPPHLAHSVSQTPTDKINHKKIKHAHVKLTLMK